MNVNNLLQLDEGDHSIITGFGCHPSKFDEEEQLVDLDGPQATSTVGTKKSRYDLIQEYLHLLDDAETGSSSEQDTCALTQVPCLLDVSHKDQQSSEKQGSTNILQPTSGSSDSHNLGNITSLSLINVDAMSGLSSSKFLVDHTQLTTTEVSMMPPSSTVSKKPYHVPPDAHHSDDEYDMESAAPEFTQQELEDLEADLSQFEGSDLSQGEDEECIAAGLGPKFLSPSPEIMRSGQRNSQEYSHKLSSISKPRELYFGKDMTEEKGEGVPSFMLEAQRSLLMEAQISQERRDKDALFQPEDLSHSEVVFQQNSVNFDAAQISARSTMFCDLEESKLLSTSCNSLGSLGEAAKENLEDDISVKSQGWDMSMDWLEAEQKELASIFDGESFHRPDLDFFEEEEKVNAKQNIFMQEESCAPTGLEDSCFSGIHEVREITVRPSWIASPDKELIGPGNRMDIDDYLKLRSEALGSLGNSNGEGRPDFGLELHSPPAATKPMPLVEMSAVSHMSQSYLHPGGDMVDLEIAHHGASRDGLPVHGSNSEVNTSYSSSSQSSSSSGRSNSGSTTFQSPPRCDSGGAIPKNRSMEKCRMESDYDARARLIQEEAVSHLSRTDDDRSNSMSVILERSDAKDKRLTQNLERTLSQANNDVSSEQIRHLIAVAVNSENPQDLVNKIIQMTQKKTVHQTLDVSELDASTEILELRAQREALKSKNPGKRNKEVVGKENFKADFYHKHPNNANRQPLQPTITTQMNDMSRPLHKHMEKLKIQRTGSAPLNISREDCEVEVHPRLHFKSSHLGTNLTESVLDETVRDMPYKSRILEDTQKTQLASFHDATNSSFDSSTPCAPRCRTRSDFQKTNQSNPSLVRTGNQLYMEDKRPINNPKSAQRPLPRMGLASSLVKMPGARNFPDVTGKSQRMVLAMGNNKEASHNPISLQSSRSETTVYPNSESSDATSMRSSSMPSGLQALGTVPGTPRPHCSDQSLRQYRSQENVAHERHFNTGQDERIVLPQKIIFRNICVLGIASDETITFRNPKQRWVQLSIRLMQETVNNTPSAVSALLFKPSYFVEPKNSIDIKLALCSQLAGSWEAVLEVKVSDLAKGSGMMSSGSVSIHTIVASAQIEEPIVQLTCEGEEEIDFGIVPESCVVSREVTVINQSAQPIPAILSLQQVAATSPVFFWNEDDRESQKVVSPTHLACELPSGDTETGPIPLNMKIFIKAPHLDKVKVNESGVIEVRSQLQVELDSPNQSTIIISTIPIKAFIGAVHLQSLCSLEPLVMEAKSNGSCTAKIPLKNSSTFPIHLSIEPKDHKENFTVHPNTIVIQPHSLASANIAFTPKGKVGMVESVLLMCVEPKGMLYEVSVAGKSRAPTSDLPMPSVPIHRTLSAPVQNEVNLASALESTKSRLVFGTVAIGSQTWQKLVLRNNCVSQALSLIVGIKGSKAFQICELGSSEGRSRMNAVLEPCQELSLSIFFSPTTVDALSASLIFKPRGLSDPIKFQIPLQGYGGQSELQIADSSEGNPLIIREISPLHPAMFHTALANTGDREMFLKLQVFSDEKCSEAVPKTDISVQPSELIIRPKENRDVIIVVTGTPHIVAKTPGCLAFLQIISGDEILRRRFRRLRNKEVKTRRINDCSLLKVDWDVFYSGEKEVQVEEISLPLQPEDATIFYNSCSRIQIQLNGERQVNDDASSTVFACLDAEDTINSVADLTVLPDRTTEIISPLIHPSQRNGIATQMSNADMQSRSLAWDVFPQTLTLPESDTSLHTFFVVNFTNKQQMLEVTSSFRWLTIEPREAILPSLSSVRVAVRLVPSRIPQPVVTPIVESLQIMCENESRCATITVTPDVGNSLSSGSTNTLPSVVVTPATSTGMPPPSSTYQKLASKAPLHGVPVINTSSNVKKSTDNKANDVQMVESKRLLAANTGSIGRKNTVTSPISGNKPCENERQVAEEKSLVEVVTNNVAYPDTAVETESFVKVKLRNLDSIVHSVKADVTKLPFAVRHHQFKIKPGHYVSFPVYFRPQKTGTFSGQLKLTVVEDKKALTVQLSGKAL